MFLRNVRFCPNSGRYNQETCDLSIYELLCRKNCSLLVQYEVPHWLCGNLACQVLAEVGNCTSEASGRNLVNASHSLAPRTLYGCICLCVSVGYSMQCCCVQYSRQRLWLVFEMCSLRISAGATSSLRFIVVLLSSSI
jgi:hypothetical protein